MNDTMIPPAGVAVKSASCVLCDEQVPLRFDDGQSVHVARYGPLNARYTITTPCDRIVASMEAQR